MGCRDGIANTEGGITMASGIRSICNMNTCSGSYIQSGAMDSIGLSFDYFVLFDLISFPELSSDSGSQCYV